MDKHEYWMKIDNAGKVFHAVSNNSRSSTFRLSMYVNEDVDKSTLQTALNIVLPRFESFKVKIKNGLFWNYFTTNNNPCLIELESSHIGQYAMKKSNQYCFRVMYYGKRITLETFHAISDGTGAGEFLKSIVYEYLKLKGKSIESEGKILIDKPSNLHENSDSFLISSDQTNKKGDNEILAYSLPGDLYPNNWSSFVKASVDLDKIKALAKEKDCTLTMYIAALYLYSLYISEPDARGSKKPFILSIPVNLRKYFNSNTLRNFSLFIKVVLPLNGKTWDLDSIIEEIKPQFNEQLNKDFLQRRINYYVAFEKNFAIRMLPLFIKNLAFKLIYFLQSNRITTTYISNLGSVNLPSSMYNEVKDVDFVNAGEKLYMTMASINNKLNIMFSSRIRDHSIIYNFLKLLQERDIDIVLQTNHSGME